MSLPLAAPFGALWSPTTGWCTTPPKLLRHTVASIGFPGDPHLEPWPRPPSGGRTGDSHNAINLALGLDAGQTLALHAAELGAAGGRLNWTREAAQRRVGRRARGPPGSGLLDHDHELTDAGRALLVAIEARTDALASRTL